MMRVTVCSILMKENMHEYCFQQQFNSNSHFCVKRVMNAKSVMYTKH